MMNKCEGSSNIPEDLDGHSSVEVRNYSGGYYHQTGVPEGTGIMKYQDGRDQVMVLSYEDRVIMAREQFSMNI